MATTALNSVGVQAVSRVLGSWLRNPFLDDPSAALRVLVRRGQSA